MHMTHIDTPTPIGGRSGRRSGRLLVPVLGLGAMVVSMMQTLTVPILGVIQRDLHTTTAGASWLTTATLLSAAVCTPLLGRYGDQNGARRPLIGVLGLTLTGSVLGATTHALPWLIVARALQGASTAIFPLAQSVVRDELPRERLPGAMALLSGTLAVGNAVALVGAGLLTRGRTGLTSPRSASSRSTSTIRSSNATTPTSPPTAAPSWHSSATPAIWPKNSRGAVSR
ncbi:MFS transporter [Microbispora rosea]|uniref:MFS transporter n=1 Tax=Microbispora rosea TaxID=58117 RepID=UPI00379054BA